MILYSRKGLCNSSKLLIWTEWLLDVQHHWQARDGDQAKLKTLLDQAIAGQRLAWVSLRSLSSIWSIVQCQIAIRSCWQLRVSSLIMCVARLKLRIEALL